MKPKAINFQLFFRYFFFSFISLLSLNCLWDNDTLEMEQQKFPGSLELITGKFLRHSKEFYAWKIADRTKKIREFPDSVSLYDDLAVAFCKTGKMHKAIGLMHKKEKLKPGLYETYSNLGTFYMLDGKWKEGVPWIEKALAINPNAHFGREKYQLILAKYVIPKLDESGKLKLPMSPSCEYSFNGDTSFLKLVDHSYSSESVNRMDVLKGIGGMMLFAGHQSPVLLEVYGETLLSLESARLAAFAFRAAAANFPEGSREWKSYNEKMDWALNKIPEFTGDVPEQKQARDDFEIEFADKITEGNQFFEEIKENEISWIAGGEDPEAAFAEKYYIAQDNKSENATAVKNTSSVEPREHNLSKVIPMDKPGLFFWMSAAGLAGGIVYLSFYFWRRRNCK